MIVEHTAFSGGSPSSHLLFSSSLTLVTPPSTHVASLVLQPHIDLQFLSLPTRGVPHSRAHLKVSQSGAADVVVLIDVLVVEVVVDVASVPVVDDLVDVMDDLDDVVKVEAVVVVVTVTVSVVFVDVLVVDEIVLVLEVSVVVGSAVVVVSTTAGQPGPWNASSGHSVWPESAQVAFT